MSLQIDFAGTTDSIRTRGLCVGIIGNCGPLTLGEVR